MLYRSAYQEIAAERVAVNGIDLIVFIDDVPVAVPAHYFDMLFRPAELRQAEQPAAAVKIGKRSRAKSSQKSLPPQQSSEPADRSAVERVLAALGKRPMTSAELIQALGVSAASVYTALSTMRKDGRVESKVDEDGIRKNFAVR